MVVEHCLVHEGLVACHAVELACCLFVTIAATFISLRDLALSVDARNRSFPAEQAPLVPLAVKHFDNRIVYFGFEIDQWLNPLEEVA